LYVTELRRDLKEIGLVPVGSALLVENFDGWVLGRRARGLVAGIADPDRREMVRDFCIDQRFRCDVFARDASPLTASKQRERLVKAEEVPAVALPCGTALDIDQDIVRLLSGADAGGMSADWREFLELHGV